MRPNLACVPGALPFTTEDPQTDARVVRVLERLRELRGLPQILVMDNGPEFAGQALDVWAYDQGVRIDFSRPGKPTDNAYVESFNGTFRAECLDAHWFDTLSEAKQVIEAWRREYNESRPHRALGERTPNKFAGQFVAGRKLTSLQAAANSPCG